MTNVDSLTSHFGEREALHQECMVRFERNTLVDVHVDV